MADPAAPPVADARPPDAVLRILNPLLRALLGSPAGRVLPGSLAILELTGRRTGRAYRVVVGWHELDDGPVVFTPARWRLNLRGGAPVAVVRNGRRRRGTATLVEDPEQVAAGLQRTLDAGAAPRELGLKVAPGHRIDAGDVRANGRAMIRVALG
jgi:hypothetical protein